MNTAILTPSTQPILAAARALNRLNVQYVEKVSHLNLESLQAQTDLALANLRVGAEVGDVAGLKTYFTRQGEVAKVALERFACDAKALAKLGRQYNIEVNQLLDSRRTPVVAETVTQKAA